MRWLMVVANTIGCIDYDQEVPQGVTLPPHEAADPMAAVPGEDVVIAPEQGPVDVLFVVDDSGSMLDDQARLLGYAPKFILPLLANRVRFHFGVTTTDGREPQVGVIDWIDETSADPVGASMDLLDVGVGGSGEEQGIKATWYAFKKQRDENAGFFRPDASLHLIYITDEPDQSATRAYDRFDERILELSQWRNRVVHNPSGSRPFTISAIVQDQDLGPLVPGPCGAEYAGAYVDLALAYPGEVIPICSLDWTAAIDQIARGFVGPQTIFPLEERPVAGTLTVLVQYPDDRSPTGVTTVDPDGWTWEYLPVPNAVVFDPELFPAELLHTVILNYTVEYY